jgi:DNA-binding MurR/RpiR family transcriptional regulator
MKYYKKTIVPIIESHYDSLSAVEKNIADFFIGNRVKMDFSSKNISTMLYVSEASLSRFAKKCGYKGYREFVFHYRESFDEEEQDITGQMRMVFDAYQELLNKSYNLVDENQLRRVVAMMSERNRVFVYGKGSSGLAAREMQIRFMRLGLDMDAIDDSDVMRMNSAILNERSIVMGISISGKTEEVLFSLRKAHENGACTVLITACTRPGYQEFCDEVIYVAARKNLDFGNLISPQFPILVIADILYGYYQEIDEINKKALYDNTLQALNRLADKEEEETNR